VDGRGRPLADWWQRLVAIVIDGIILGVPNVLVSLAVDGKARKHGLTAHFGLKVAVVGIVFTLIGLAYFAYFNGSEKGQTPGQMLLGIAVRDQASGGRIQPQGAAIRIIVLEPGILLQWVPVVGILAGLYTLVAAFSPMWDKSRQGFHDKVANTLVIKVR
jgi:uncharacterized RDD family membrane protein YckC